MTYWDKVRAPHHQGGSRAMENNARSVKKKSGRRPVAVPPGRCDKQNKGVWGMPRLSEAKKDAISCENPRGAAHEH